MLYLDFKKAFDNVPRDLLLQKSEKLDIGGNFLKIVASYISDHQQYVKVNDCISERVPVTSGVRRRFITRPATFHKICEQPTKGNDRM